MDLAELEGWAGAMLRASNVDTDGPVPVVALARAVTGHAPRWTSLPQASVVRGGVIYLRRGLPLTKAREAVCHELAEVAHAGYCGADIEARCDTLGAMLLAPRGAFRRAVTRLGHRVHELAKVFCCSQSLALLRVGEVTGRPVMLLTPRGQLARGDAFGWPSTSTLVRALRDGRSRVHPLQITDAPDRWGLMAERAAWLFAD